MRRLLPRNEPYCAACRKRGWPDAFGSPPKCAFPTGVFISDNWNCAGLDKLRDVCKEREEMSYGFAYSEDERLCALPVEEGFLVATWYKNRGCTTSLRLIDFDGRCLRVTEKKLARLGFGP